MRRALIAVLLAGAVAVRFLLQALQRCDGVVVRQARFGRKRRHGLSIHRKGEQHRTFGRHPVVFCSSPANPAHARARRGPAAPGG